jgi:polysaccharide export outer membrane protein
MNSRAALACSVVACVFVLGRASVSAAQSAAAPQPHPSATALPTGSSAMPADYVIGPDDVLTVSFWQVKDLDAEAVVRPDGNITLPLLNDLKAAGLTPEQLRERVIAEARRYIEDPNATVVVKQINSRKVFITGQVQKPGAYPITGVTTVVQLIATAGGLVEFANSKNILIMRQENGRQVAHRFNYKEILARRNLWQNIELKPADTVIVP